MPTVRGIAGIDNCIAYSGIGTLGGFLACLLNYLFCFCIDGTSSLFLLQCNVIKIKVHHMTRLCL